MCYLSSTEANHASINATLLSQGSVERKQEVVSVLHSVAS